MASKFLVPDRDQSFLRVASYRDLLGDDGLVWTVIGVVEGLDLSAVYARYGDDIGQGGRPAFDPAMMLTLLVFGYCEGRRSARELETACRRDVAYQAICGGMVPDHATIARFRVMIDDVVESLFVQVLAACRERGLVDVGRVALDGTKIGAAASKDANRSVERLSELEIQIRQILNLTSPDSRLQKTSDGAFIRACQVFLCEVVVHVVGSRRPGKVMANALSACFHPWVPVPSSPLLLFPMLRIAK